MKKGDEDLFLAMMACKQENNELLSEEQAALDAWLAKSPNNKDYYKEMLEDFKIMNSPPSALSGDSERMYYKAMTRLAELNAEQLSLKGSVFEKRINTFVTQWNN